MASMGGGDEVANASTPLIVGRALVTEALTEPAGDTAACDRTGDTRLTGEGRANGVLDGGGVGLLCLKVSNNS